MKKRDMENCTAFSKEVQRACNMYDMQGLCKDADDRYTIAVEAFDMENNNLEDYKRELSDEELYIKASFALKVGAVFTLLLHTKKNGSDKIVVRMFAPEHVYNRNCTGPVVRCIYDKMMTESEFVTWWKSKKAGRQTKPYRAGMAAKIRASYFDNLMESNGSSWCGNIDGFLVRKDASGQIKIVGIVENRYSNKLNIDAYNPNAYFKYNGGDYRTWSELKSLADHMGVPLFLCTYSRMPGMERKVGMTQVTSVTSSGLSYKFNLVPGANVKSSPEDANKWLTQAVDAFLGTSR